MLLAVVDVACLDMLDCVDLHYKTAVKPHVNNIIMTLYYETACFLRIWTRLYNLSARFCIVSTTLKPRKHQM